VITKQFKLIRQIPLILGRTVLHMSMEARMARDFPEINRHVSPLRQEHWDPAAQAQFKEALTKLVPARIARRLWSVKTARALLLDRLIGTRHGDQFAGFGFSVPAARRAVWFSHSPRLAAGHKQFPARSNWFMSEQNPRSARCASSSEINSVRPATLPSNLR
jgi:hypothetical protein